MSGDSRKAFRFDQREVTMLKIAVSDLRRHCLANSSEAEEHDDRASWTEQAAVLSTILEVLWEREVRK